MLSDSLAIALHGPLRAAGDLYNRIHHAASSIEIAPKQTGWFGRLAVFSEEAVFLMA